MEDRQSLRVLKLNNDAPASHFILWSKSLAATSSEATSISDSLSVITPYSTNRKFNEVNSFVRQRVDCNRTLKHGFDSFIPFKTLLNKMERNRKHVLEARKKFLLQLLNETEQELQALSAAEQEDTTSQERRNVSLLRSESERPKAEHPRRASRIPKRIQSLPTRPKPAYFIKDNQNEEGTNNQVSLNKQEPASTSDQSLIQPHPHQSGPIEKTVSKLTSDSIQTNKESQRQNGNQDHQRTGTRGINRSKPVTVRPDPKAFTARSDKKEEAVAKNHLSQKNQPSKSHKISTPSQLSGPKRPVSRSDSQKQNGNQEHQRINTKRTTPTQPVTALKDIDTSSDKKKETGTRNPLSKNNQPLKSPKTSTPSELSGSKHPATVTTQLSSTKQTTIQLSRFPTFKKRPGTQDLGREFEQNMCAYYALRLAIHPEVKDFRMSSNNIEDGKFDDIGFTVIFLSGNSRKYLFQLKHKENKKILISDLKSESAKSDFGIKSYTDSILKKDHEEDTVYILSTNCLTKIDKNLKLWDSIAVEECTQFHLKEVLVNSTENSQNEIFEIKTNDLKQTFYLFTSQMNVKQTEGKINALLKSLLQTDIYGAFISYMRHWWLGRFFLTKHDIFAKIAELAFSPFLAILTDKKSNEKTATVAKAVMSFPLTIVEDAKENIIRNIWKTEESPANKEFDRAKNKYGLTEDRQSTTLWYLKKLPLIVKIDDLNRKTIKCVMAFLRQSLEDKKIILIGKATKDDFQEWNTLENLSDLSDKCKEEEFCLTILTKFKIALQGTESISLEELVKIDRNAAKLVKIRELLQMTQQDSLHFGNQKIKEQLSEAHIPRSVSPVFIKKEEIFNCYKSSSNTILVVNCDQTFADSLSKNKDVNIMELSEFGGSPEEGASLILKSTNSMCTNQEFERICEGSPKSNVYLLQQFNDGYFILILRKGKKLDSKDSNLEQAVKDSQIFEVYNNSLHAFCAPPGMGKSTLMKVLHNNCPHPSVYVSLINHNLFLEEKPNFETILSRFLQIDQMGEDLWKQLRKHFWKNRKLYMFLDGLDEVNSEHLNCVLNFVKYASSQGGYIWLSSRENLRDAICQTLNVVPIDIKELDQEEQKVYINLKLKEQYKTEEIRKITEAVFKSSDLNNSQKLLGIPLQLHIITDMFLKNRQLYENLETKNPFVLSQMYRIYFEGKIKFGYTKVVNPKLKQQLGHLKSILESYEVPALMVCLQKEDCKRLHIDIKDVKEFLDEIKREGDKNGIIRSIGENDEVVFEHLTYAEYFACVWFKKNPKKFKKLGDKIFTKKYENLRLIFDVILAENNPLHLTVIYKDSKNFQMRLTDPNSKCDDGGRTVFHLAFSYGRKYPPRVEIRKKYLQQLRTLKREKPYYAEMMQLLLKDGKIPGEKDKLFAFDCISYALISECLYPLEEVLRTKSLTFDQLETPLKKCFDEMALAYCSAQFGYPNLLSELVKSDKVSEEKEDLLEIAMKGCDADVCSPPRDGNIAAAKILIEDAAISKTKMNKILQEACENKFFDMLEILKENGAECTNGNTILHHLVERCPGTYCAEIVNVIEKFDIDVTASNNKGVTALHKAAESADLKIVEALMDKGADPSVVDHDGRNALHHASSNSRQEVLGLFLNKGLPVDLPDKNGATALHLASEKGKIENVNLLLTKYADFNLVDKDKNNALHYASRSRTPNQHVIRLLAYKGLSVNEQNQNGQTPVHLACQGNNLGNVKILSYQAADLGLKDNDGNSLFNYALKSSTTLCKEIVNLLKLCCFDFNRKNQDGMAPIHFAYQKEDFDIVNLLLEIGADDEVNAKFKDGETLLHWACVHNKNNLAIVLLEKGADPNATDNNEKNPLYHSLGRSLYLPDLVHAMLRHGLNLKTRYQNGQTLLHFACFHCDTHTVRELCEKTVDVNTLDDDQRNPLDDVLKRLFDVEASEKLNLETRYKSYTQHEHEAGRIQFGCADCYCELVKTLGEVDKDTSFRDFVRQKLSMFINNETILDIFINNVMSANSANETMDIVARFMIFEMVYYLRENGLKINNTSASDETGSNHSSDWEQNYPEISDLLNNA